MLRQFRFLGLTFAWLWCTSFSPPALPCLPAQVASAKARHSTGTLAPGTPSATAYYIQDSGVRGPTVMIVGGVHGNEPAGAEAAEQIRHWPILKGKLIVLPRASVTALRAKTRNTPNTDTNLLNLNRNFPKAKGNGPARGVLAQAIWELVKTQKPDWLLDLHEGYDFNQLNGDSVGSSVIAFSRPEEKAEASRLLDAVNATITEEKKKFVRRGPPIDGSLARAASEHLGIHAMILETTSKNQPLSKRSLQHRIMVRQFLKDLGMIADSVKVDSFLKTPNPVGRLAADPVFDPLTSRGEPAYRLCRSFQ